MTNINKLKTTKGKQILREKMYYQNVLMIYMYICFLSKKSMHLYKSRKIDCVTDENKPTNFQEVLKHLNF